MGTLGVAVAQLSDSLLEYGVAVLAICLLMVLIWRPKNLPPGPTGLPIIGSPHLLGQRPHERLAQMAQKYRPLMSFYMGQKLCIVAASAETAMEFLKTQDAIFSSRPPLRGFEVIFPKDITFSDITPAARQLRKIFHLQLTSGRRIEESEHIRADEIAQMLRSIPGDKVVNLKSCLEAMTANILTRLIIGKRFMGRSGMDKSEEKELKDFIHITEEIGLCLGTANPRDVIPAFKWIDLNGLDRRFKNLRSHMESFLAKIVAEHRHRREESFGSFDPPEKDLLDLLLDQMEKKRNHRRSSDQHRLGGFRSRNGDIRAGNRMDHGRNSAQSIRLRESSSGARRSGRANSSGSRIRHSQSQVHQGNCEGSISTSSNHPSPHSTSIDRRMQSLRVRHPRQNTASRQRLGHRQGPNRVDKSSGIQPGEIPGRRGSCGD